ncbi:type II toxin-antitoxin system Phd/YefM family antitoxin [Pediococcus argentinicus]|uniref:type II toxin-antitoxin system Phd/YefM family antitoxin n=1 Tax=Pediococcus argentinicus TaxID=480391 RepID=UPI00338FC0C1
MEVYTPTGLSSNLYKALNTVVEKHEPIEVTIKDKIKKTNSEVVIIGKDEWNKLKEAQYLYDTGTLDVVLDRMKNEKPGDFNDQYAY